MGIATLRHGAKKKNTEETGKESRVDREKTGAGMDLEAKGGKHFQSEGVIRWVNTSDRTILMRTVK